MNKNEFCDLVGIKDLTDSDYKKIEFVYMFHPAIESKQEIAQCYKMTHGMMMIELMTPVAELNQRAETAMRLYQMKMNKARDIMGMIKDGYIKEAEEELNNLGE